MLVAVWDAYADGGTSAFVASSTDAGRMWTRPQGLSDAGVSATHPRVIKTASSFRAFWTERVSGQGSRWTTKALSPLGRAQ